MPKKDEAPKAAAAPKKKAPAKKKATDAPKPAPKAAPKGDHLVAGLVPTRLHVKGTHWQGNLVELIRCAPSGEYGDRWMVHAQGSIYNTSGNPMQPVPFQQLPPNMQPKVAFELAAAIKLARKL